MTYLQKYLFQTAPNKQHLAAIAYLASLDHIATTAPHVSASIIQELKDQRSHLKMIASENFSSFSVQLAMGNWLTDKYAEGFPHHRFYAGCNNVDLLEEDAQNQLKELFGAEHAYAQPHSGADANMVAFWAILVHRVQNQAVSQLGKKNLDELTKEEYEQIRQLLVNQKIMGMSLNSGGHLTHGYRHNISSKMMQAVSYDVNPETELIDYKVLAEQVQQEKPAILLAGYSAYPRLINFAKMREIADQVDAVLMVDMAHFAGLVAGKVLTGEFNPVPYAQMVTSTTHKTMRGPRGGFLLCSKEYGDTVNKGCPLVLGGPLPHVVAAKSIAFREANTPGFVDYAHRIVENSQALADCLIEKGMRITTNGTDNHLLIIDLTKLGITGRQGETALRAAKITANRNTIPFDKNGPWNTSGIRLGTPALTTLGMGKDEMREIATIIVDVLTHTKPALIEGTQTPSKAHCITDPDILHRAQTRVGELLHHFPLYPEIELL